jgi:hypothetical protein
MNRTETTGQADEGAEAWRVPPRQYLREHPPGYEGARRTGAHAVQAEGGWADDHA